MLTYEMQVRIYIVWFSSGKFFLPQRTQSLHRGHKELQKSLGILCVLWVFSVFSVVEGVHCDHRPLDNRTNRSLADRRAATPAKHPGADVS